jgi:hypothetical protein
MLVLVATLAFALGAAGSAVAGSALTKGQVKKIAAKVVAKAAPNLTVKKAATATNASKLDGIDAASYLNKSYRYRLPVQAPSSSRLYAFPELTGGTYLFTYDVIMSGTTTSTFCDMLPSTSPVGGEGYSTATPTTGFGRLHGSGIIKFTGNTVRLQCGGSSFTIYGGSETLSSVTFTRIDALTEGTATSS